MKIVVYCQHVLGIGHFFRTLAICRALDRHDVILVTGGPKVDATLPAHVRTVRLPGLEMNREFKDLHPTDPGKNLDRVKSLRREMLFSLFKTEAPDLFLTELYPFGRKAFRFELDPVLEGIRTGGLPKATTVSSVRDILVEREDAEKYEKRVTGTLNRLFDGLVVHSDAGFINLGETFSRLQEIAIPIHYSGFVTPFPETDARQRIRHQIALKPEERLAVVSAGGGKVGDRLIAAVLTAIPLMKIENRTRFVVFTGPYLEASPFARMKKIAGNRATLRRFSNDFLSYLGAADFSVSMAGYNTTMNILAARVPALVWPFPQNREQGMRAKRLAELGALTVLSEEDLSPRRLAGLMDQMEKTQFPSSTRFALEGAAATARFLESLAADKVAVSAKRGS